MRGFFLNFLKGKGTGSGHRTLLYGNAILLRHQNSDMVNRKRILESSITCFQFCSVFGVFINFIFQWQVILWCWSSRPLEWRSLLVDCPSCKQTTFWGWKSSSWWRFDLSFRRNWTIFGIYATNIFKTTESIKICFLSTPQKKMIHQL